MAIILDADVIIRGEKRSFDLAAWLESLPDATFELAAITVAELWHGVERAGPKQRIRPADGDLQTGQVDHVRDSVTLQRGTQRRQIRDIAPHKGNLMHLLLAQDQAQAARVFLKVIDPGLITPGQQIADNPGPNTTVATRQQYTHRSSHPSGHTENPS